MATLNQLQKTLFITYAAVPLVTELDKFTNLLQDLVMAVGAYSFAQVTLLAKKPASH